MAGRDHDAGLAPVFAHGIREHRRGFQLGKEMDRDAVPRENPGRLFGKTVGFDPGVEGDRDRGGRVTGCLLYTSPDRQLGRDLHQEVQDGQNQQGDPVPPLKHTDKDDAEPIHQKEAGQAEGL